MVGESRSRSRSRSEARKTSAITFLALATGFLIYYSIAVSSIPDGITTTIVGNTTKTGASGGIVNFTGNDTAQPNKAGGFIFIMNISGETQNVRWKAFVGNATGKLTLEDSLGAVIYDWSLSTITGEVYTTRSSGSVNWTGIGCASLNVTEHENRILNHTVLDDNITATFASSNHDAITVGTVTVPANACRNTNIYLNSTTNPSAIDTFEEVVLYDTNSTGFNFSGAGDSSATGKVVYTQILEANQRGYNNQSTYDFQMLVPERGESGWTSSTPYYFYIELS